MEGLSITQVARGTKISFADTKIILAGIDAEQIGLDDFVFL
jgi:hypothetical protein